MTRLLLAATLVAAPASVTVRARDNAFSPSSRSVAVGGRVTFTNAGQVAHEVTANDGSFASGNIAPGASWTYTASRAGSFGYVCRYHPGMTGRLVVSASGLAQTGGGRELPAGLALLLVTAAAGALLRVAR